MSLYRIELAITRYRFGFGGVGGCGGGGRNGDGLGVTGPTGRSGTYHGFGVGLRGLSATPCVVSAFPHPTASRQASGIAIREIERMNAFI